MKVRWQQIFDGFLSTFGFSDSPDNSDSVLRFFNSCNRIQPWYTRIHNSGLETYFSLLSLQDEGQIRGRHSRSLFRKKGKYSYRQICIKSFNFYHLFLWTPCEKKVLFVIHICLKLSFCMWYRNELNYWVNQKSLLIHFTDKVNKTRKDFWITLYIRSFFCNFVYF